MTAPARGLGGHSGDTVSPEGRAATLCLHPVRRWVIAAAADGSVSSRDLFREFPYLGMPGASGHLKALCHLGVLRQVGSRQGQSRTTYDTYELADLTDLRALHVWLGTVLKENA